jgi:hypothetical protein
MAFGGGFVGVTVFDLPLTKTDAPSNQVIRRRVGRSGDALLGGFSSI